ncbi:helix-turn-helix domain-containing protein [Kitasatospora sp. NPDC088351]|uniref:helix-turn-helix domain-containing protein n=1 Tax=Kitasatospora sp. NPDC088351 TaxID=3155180 RepID=UPI003412FE52
MVLHAARGRPNACIARETGLHLDTVRRWRGRFAQAGLPGLEDRQRCGRPASFTPLQAAEVRAPTCRLPAESEVPLSRWSCPELAREAARRGIAPFMSASTVRRRLAQDALKPWQHRSWIFIPEVIALPILSGPLPYLEWITRATRPAEGQCSDRIDAGLIQSGPVQQSE